MLLGSLLTHSSITFSQSNESSVDLLTGDIRLTCEATLCLSVW